MIDGFDLEAIPRWIEDIENGVPVFSRTLRIMSDYLEEFPEGPFAEAIRSAQAKAVIKQDDPLPTPEEIVESLEQAEADAKEKKKAAKKAARKA